MDEEVIAMAMSLLEMLKSMQPVTNKLQYPILYSLQLELERILEGKS